jgi:ABC-2 type transport system permease protein
MSAVETAPSALPPTAGLAASRRRISTRFLRSELWLIFGRRRNWAGLAVLAGVPILVSIAVKVSPPTGGGGGDGDGPNFFTSITSNGLFVALAALTLELPFMLPLAIAAISGDSVAGEANIGTLRYLLAVPVHRTRMLAVKYAALVVFAFAATALVAVVGSVMGLALFGGGDVTLLSGTQVSFGEGLLRLLLVVAYLGVGLCTLAAIGLFLSTLTEQPIGAAIALLILAIASQILDNIPQLDWLHEYLPTHYWLAFGDALRQPIATDGMAHGVLSAAVYIAVFLAAAWARFSGKDVTS